MTAMRSFASILVASLSVLALACSGISDPSKNTTTDFGPITIAPFEGKVHEFDVNRRNGEYTATIIALSPTQNAALQIFLGKVVDSLCTPILGQVGVARLNQIALNSTITSGHYCIQVFDQGAIATPQTYTLRVSHP
jgi:hypothetical protein